MLWNSWILPVNRLSGGCEVWIFINKRERGGGRLRAWWGGGWGAWVPHGLKSHDNALRHAEEWVWIITSLSELLGNFKIELLLQPNLCSSLLSASRLPQKCKKLRADRSSLLWKTGDNEKCPSSSLYGLLFSISELCNSNLLVHCLKTNLPAPRAAAAYVTVSL